MITWALMSGIRTRETFLQDDGGSIVKLNGFFVSGEESNEIKSYVPSKIAARRLSVK